MTPILFIASSFQRYSNRGSLDKKVFVLNKGWTHGPGHRLPMFRVQYYTPQLSRRPSFNLFSSFNSVDITHKFGRWLDSKNRRPLELEATALPIAPQPLAIAQLINCLSPVHTSCSDCCKGVGCVANNWEKFSIIRNAFLQVAADSQSSVKQTLFHVQ